MQVVFIDRLLCTTIVTHLMPVHVVSEVVTAKDSREFGALRVSLLIVVCVGLETKPNCRRL
jgi:hypothetical protein